MLYKKGISYLQNVFFGINLFKDSRKIRIKQEKNMAKTIKFNLILDDYPVRNLEGLQEHFSIEDILKYYENGLLLRWLDVREYKKQYEAVNNMTQEDKKEIISELVKIFEVEMCDEDIEKGIAILQYLEEEKERNMIYKENAFAKKQVIDDYHKGYEKLLIHMRENKENIEILKADVIELEREYLDLFKLDYCSLYYYLLKNAPKAVFIVLTRDVFREYWIGNVGYFSEEIYQNIKNNILSVVRMKDILREDLKIVNRNTREVWDQIERSEVKVMILSVQEGAFVKNLGNFGEKLSAQDVNQKFIKLDGLEYQCNNAAYELLYLEV